VPNVVDLSLCSEARRALHQVLAQRGLGFFRKPGQGPCARPDPRRIAWVVSAAQRRSRGHTTDHALSRTRRIVRRELIRRMADTLVSAGM